MVGSILVIVLSGDVGPNSVSSAKQFYFLSGNTALTLHMQ